MNRLLALSVGLAAAAVAGAFLLALQGRRTRARTLRLPSAAGPNRGTREGSGPDLRLVLLGESTVAGVGAPTHHAALAGQMASSLAQRTGRAVEWRAVGRSGVAAHEVLTELASELRGTAPEVLVIVLGVNDTTRLHSPRRWRRDLERLIRAVRKATGPVPIVLAGVPPMGRFPALPPPLRWVLGFWARRLDRAAARLAGTLHQVTHVRTTVESAADFAADGFHPGPVGYARWGAALARETARLVSPPPGTPSERPAAHPR